MQVKTGGLASVGQRKYRGSIARDVIMISCFLIELTFEEGPLVMCDLTVANSQLCLLGFSPGRLT